ncbi:short-chain dehydrogenase [Nitrospira sp. KM1]|uniref:SDR family oxidoreductase n=1 Tax=Nitrospira sp. KM1 TaxID=1936990 RepID=UPI0013A717B7|nr:SDR family oxidoreductase [Nitrospira sp. KM1]BCA56420.1 short-chain dehydrogenase [Nitrospira sp. KM1]
MPNLALVTGANKGIGLEIVRQLAAKDWRVFLTGRSRSQVMDAAASLGPSVTPIVLDVTSISSIESAFRTVSQETDHLDVLVNNAAIADDDDGSVFDLPAERLHRMFETNTIGPLLMIQAFLPLLRSSQSGRIINVSSGAGQLSELGTWAPAYSISKTALNGVTNQFASALTGENIPVNSVCPGWVRTDMGGSDAPRSVEQGADTIVWLATEAPQSMTGQFVKDRKAIPW